MTDLEAAAGVESLEEDRLRALIQAQEELDATYVVPSPPRWIRVGGAVYMVAVALFAVFVGLIPETTFETRVFYVLGAVSLVMIAGTLGVYLRERRRRPALMERVEAILAEKTEGGSSGLQ